MAKRSYIAGLNNHAGLVILPRVVMSPQPFLARSASFEFQPSLRFPVVDSV